MTDKPDLSAARILEGSATVVETLKELDGVAVTISFDAEGSMYLNSIGEGRWLVAAEARPGKWMSGVGQLFGLPGPGEG